MLATRGLACWPARKARCINFRLPVYEGGSTLATFASAKLLPPPPRSLRGELARIQRGEEEKEEEDGGGPSKPTPEPTATNGGRILCRSFSEHVY